jgi:hypothetical protein
MIDDYIFMHPLEAPDPVINSSSSWFGYPIEAMRIYPSDEELSHLGDIRRVLEELYDIPLEEY